VSAPIGISAADAKLAQAATTAAADIASRGAWLAPACSPTAHDKHSARKLFSNSSTVTRRRFIGDWCFGWHNSSRSQ